MGRNDMPRDVKHLVIALGASVILCSSSRYLGLFPDSEILEHNRRRETVEIRYDERTADERSELIQRVTATMARQDTAKEDPRDERDNIVTTRECVLFLKDIGVKGDVGYVVYDFGSVSVGAEKDGRDLMVFTTVGNYVDAKRLLLEDARKYLTKNEKK
ncbi:MAG: hypothetical protein AABW89_02150 [Nanoarchaeota archaeon]